MTLSSKLLTKATEEVVRRTLKRLLRLKPSPYGFVRSHDLAVKGWNRLYVRGDSSTTIVFANIELEDALRGKGIFTRVCKELHRRNIRFCVENPQSFLADFCVRQNIPIRGDIVFISLLLED